MIFAQSQSQLYFLNEQQIIITLINLFIKLTIIASQLQVEGLIPKNTFPFFTFSEFKRLIKAKEWKPSLAQDDRFNGCCESRRGQSERLCSSGGRDRLRAQGSSLQRNALRERLLLACDSGPDRRVWKGSRTKHSCSRHDLSGDADRQHRIRRALR